MRSTDGLMSSFQLGSMVFHDGEKPLVLDVSEGLILPVLDEEPEMVEQLAETNVRRQFAELLDSLQQFLLR